MTPDERRAMRRKNRQERLQVQAYQATLTGIRSFAGRVRQVINDKGPIQRARIAFYLDIDDQKGRNRLSAALRDLMRADYIVRPQVGVYAPGKKMIQQPTEKRQVMWRILRSKRLVSREDLVEMAEVTRSYASEWLASLVKRDVVRDLDNGKFRLIEDTVRMPDLTDNAEKLRDIRARQKQAQELMASGISHMQKAINILAGEVSHG